MCRRARSGRPRLASTALLGVLMMSLVLPSLACCFGSLLWLASARYQGVQALLPTRTPWPTFTPTATATPRVMPAMETEVPAVEDAPTQVPAPVLTPTAAAPIAVVTPVETAAPPAARGDAVLPAEAPVAPPPDRATPTAPSPSPVAATSGWSFSGVTKLASDAEEGLLLTGELVNGTGAPQQAIAISGAFYDVQGQVAGDSLELASYVPIDPVPPDAHVPFTLQVSGSQGIDHFDLRAVSEPASAAPRQDFQFSGVEQWADDAVGYCMRGQVENQGPALQEYLIVLATGYDDQGSVVNFGEYYVDILPGSGAPSSTFEMCLASLGGQISRHDLKAFGN